MTWFFAGVALGWYECAVAVIFMRWFDRRYLHQSDTTPVRSDPLQSGERASES